MPSKQGLTTSARNANNVANKAQGSEAQYAGEAGTGYSDFAATGGVTPEEQQLTREQAASGIGSLYSSLKKNLAQRQKIQGGYSPGYGANVNQLGRSAAADTGTAINSANLGLLQQIRQGKLAGLGGQANLASLYGSQIVPALGVGENAAAARPGLNQEINSWAQTAMNPIMAGFGAGA